MYLQYTDGICQLDVTTTEDDAETCREVAHACYTASTLLGAHDADCDTAEVLQHAQAEFNQLSNAHTTGKSYPVRVETFLTAAMATTLIAAESGDVSDATADTMAKLSAEIRRKTDEPAIRSAGHPQKEPPEDAWADGVVGDDDE